MSKKIELDLAKGSIYKNIFIVAIPLCLTLVLQIFFNTADTFVLGVLVNHNAVAAVGSTVSLTNLIIGLATGLSLGTNVVLGRAIGNKDAEKCQKIVGMSIVLSLVLGVIFAVIGFCCARTFLLWMDCDPKVIDMAVKYMKIYFAGMPIVLIYNFCSSILRASGDTKRPLIYLAIGGVVNIVLNVVMIVAFNNDVEGVAIATITSFAISSFLAIRAIYRAEGIVKLKLKNLRFYKQEFIEILKIGIPSGIQSSLFSISNVIIQSAINSFGDFAMAGSAYSFQLEGYIYNICYGFTLANMSIVGQNHGAGRLDRIKESIIKSTLVSSIITIAVAFIGVMVTRPLITMINGEANEVVEYAVSRIKIVGIAYVFCATMDMFSTTLRTLGKSMEAMIIVLFSVCVLRVAWIKLILPLNNQFFMIFISFPISWAISTVVLMIYLMRTIKKMEV